MSAYDPGDCPRCGGTQIIRIPSTVDPGDWVTISCPRCTDYGARVQQVIADLEACMGRHEPDVDRTYGEQGWRTYHEGLAEERAERRAGGVLREAYLRVAS